VGGQGDAVVSPTVFSGSSDAYDRFMGRYSRQLARAFADFLGVEPGLRALDIGAGTGALTAELVDRVGPDAVAALEPSADFAAVLRERFPRSDVREGPAEALPWDDGTFDIAASQLVVIFMRDTPSATRDLRRVLRRGGVGGACMWELDGMEATRLLNEVRTRVRPEIRAEVTTEYRSEESLRVLFESAGFREIETTRLRVTAEYDSVDELWEPAIRVGGPGGPVAASATPEQLARGREALEQLLGSPRGRFTLSGRAAAVRGISG
jgi:ubiquinone/menaquinone biosynthesis C-methylase UbiE